MEFKVPTSKAEMEELRKSLVQEISDDDLDVVAGGNDNVKNGKNKQGVEFTCPYCHKVLILYKANDGPKHMVQECTANPYK